ncbi:MAG: AAA family ATPase [Solirubrobacterales bacterium]
MKLVGYACRHPEQPLRRVFLPLSDFTVLLGQNDAGKSSLLRAIERDLSGGHYERTAEEDRRYIGAAFYAEASEDELKSLTEAAQNLRRHSRKRSRSYFGSRPPWGLREWKFEALPLLDTEETDPVGAWLSVLGDKATAEIRPALESLATSRLLSFEPAGFDRGERVWNVGWCLSSFGSLPAEVREALEASRLLPFAARREKAAIEHSSWYSKSFYVFSHGVPRHLWLRGAPVLVAPIGQSRGTHFPRGVAVPIEFDELHAEVERSLNDLVNACRHGLEIARAEGDISAEEEAARRPPRNWLEEGTDATWRVHPDAEGAAAFIAAAANRAVPKFLGGRYQLQVTLRRVDDWVGSDGEALALSLRKRRDDAIVEEFPVEDAADGLRLWVQLALLQACEQAARVGAELDELAAEWWVHAQQAEAPNPGEDEAELDEYAAHYESEFEKARRELRSIAAGEKNWPEGVLERALARRQPENWTSRSARHRRLFIVDEPERHLHPNVQREAAAWLKRSTAEQSGTCLLATHSTPFLALPSDQDAPLYVYARRTDQGTACEAFDADEIHGLDQIVAELGFDRGELLTTIALFLVVEGIHDLVVLDRLFGELRAARIALLPMEGLSNYQAVLDSDALWRYTTAEVALCTDKFELELLKEVVTDPKKAKELRRSDAPGETKILAKLLGNAERSNKRVYLLGHPGDDLIDVLDESVIKQEFPDYPGHQEAQKLWRQEVEAGARAKQKKAFYERNFRIPASVDGYAKLVEAHAEAGIRPAALQAIVDSAIALTRGEVPEAMIATTPYRAPDAR